ncbi:MAG: hypothetical protein ACKPKO_40960, partial [Candidatus Fonsibacter sp.]
SPMSLRGSMAKRQEEEDADALLQELQVLEPKAELLKATVEAAEAEGAAEERGWYQEATCARDWYAEADDEAMLDQEEG